MQKRRITIGTNVSPSFAAQVKTVLKTGESMASIIRRALVYEMARRKADA